MSAVKLRKWGNSMGVTLPIQEVKAINAHIGDTFEVHTNKKGEIILSPANVNLQSNWLEAFNCIADTDADELLIDDINNEFDKDEWQW